MKASIAKIGEKIKVFSSNISKETLFLVLSLCLICSSFGTGILVGKEIQTGNKNEVRISYNAQTASVARSIQGKGEEHEIVENIPSEIKKIALQKPEGAQFLASKNGTRYYLPNCSGAGRIKPENRVWFKTREDAEAAGLTPAANCPGL